MATQTQKPAPKPAQNGAGWSETVNLAGSEAAQVSGSKDLPANAKGKVKAKCLGVAPFVKNDGSGKKTISFKLQVIEPAFLSGLIFGKVNPDPSNEKGRNFWNTTLQSFGVPAAAIQKGPLKLSESLFKGKTCLLYLDPEKNSKGYDKREFMTPADFEAASWPDENAIAPEAPETAAEGETTADPFAA